MRMLLWRSSLHLQYSTFELSSWNSSNYITTQWCGHFIKLDLLFGSRNNCCEIMLIVFILCIYSIHARLEKFSLGRIENNNYKERTLFPVFVHFEKWMEIHLPLGKHVIFDGRGKLLWLHISFIWLHLFCCATPLPPFHNGNKKMYIGKARQRNEFF